MKYKETVCIGEKSNTVEIDFENMDQLLEYLDATGAIKPKVNIKLSDIKMPPLSEAMRSFEKHCGMEGP
jgi:hypothetical protein